MRHFTSPLFWQLFSKLPPNIQNLANSTFERLKKNTRYPSLHLKKVDRYWSVRIGKKYRTLAVEVDLGLLWFWIGTHSEYEQIIK